MKFKSVSKRGVRIKRVEFIENWCRGFLSQGTKQTVRKNEVSVKQGLTVLEFSVPSSSLRSRRLEVAGERENGRARGRHACLLLARPFLLVPTTSKPLLRRLPERIKKKGFGWSRSCAERAKWISEWKSSECIPILALSYHDELITWCTLAFC